MFKFTFVTTVTNGNLNYYISVFFFTVYKRQLCLFKKMSSFSFAALGEVAWSRTTTMLRKVKVKQVYGVETKLRGWGNLTSWSKNVLLKCNMNTPEKLFWKTNVFCINSRDLHKQKKKMRRYLLSAGSDVIVRPDGMWKQPLYPQNPCLKS